MDSNKKDHKVINVMGKNSKLFMLWIALGSISLIYTMNQFMTGNEEMGMGALILGVSGIPLVLIKIIGIKE